MELPGSNNDIAIRPSTLAEANKRIDGLESWIGDLQAAFLKHGHVNGELVEIKRWGKQE